MFRRIATTATPLRALLYGQRRFVIMTWGKYKGKDFKDFTHDREYLEKLLPQFEFLNSDQAAALYQALGRPPLAYECQPEKVGLYLLATATSSKHSDLSFQLGETSTVEAFAEALKTAELQLTTSQYKLTRVHIGKAISCSDTLAPALAQILTKFGSELEHVEIVASQNAVQLLTALTACNLQTLALYVPTKLSMKTVQQLSMRLKDLPPIADTIKFAVSDTVGKELLKGCADTNTTLRANKIIFAEPERGKGGLRPHCNQNVDKALTNILGKPWSKVFGVPLERYPYTTRTVVGRKYIKMAGQPTQKNPHALSWSLGTQAALGLL